MLHLCVSQYIPVAHNSSTVRSESRCALRLRQSPVELWWHTVTHGEKVTGKVVNWVGNQSKSVYVDLVVSIPCVTVCRHISIGLYRSLSVQHCISLVYLRHYAFWHGRTIIGHECTKALRQLLNAADKQQEVIQLCIKWKSGSLLLQFNGFVIN